MNAPAGSSTYGGGMTRLQVVLVWAIAVALFLFVEGPVWNDPWNFSRLNAAILLSYAPIPLLVLGCLAWRRRVGMRAFLLDTSLVVMLKYATTFMLAMVLWELRPEPPVKSAYASPTSRARAHGQASVAYPPAAFDGGSAVVEGRVIDSSGAPAPGAVVWIAGDLDGVALPPTEDPVRLARSDRIDPSIAIVAPGQPISGTSADGRLHTLVAASEHGPLFNVPLLPSGDASIVRVPDVTGTATLRCTVHPHEEQGVLVVAPSRLHARTDESGRFSIAGVPARALVVETLGRGGKTSVRVTPRSGERLAVELKLVP